MDRLAHGPVGLQCETFRSGALMKLKRVFSLLGILGGMYNILLPWSSYPENSTIGEADAPVQYEV